MCTATLQLDQYQHPQASAGQGKVGDRRGLRGVRRLRGKGAGCTLPHCNWISTSACRQVQVRGGWDKKKGARGIRRQGGEWAGCALPHCSLISTSIHRQVWKRVRVGGVCREERGLVCSATLQLDQCQHPQARERWGRPGRMERSEGSVWRKLCVCAMMLQMGSMPAPTGMLGEGINASTGRHVGRGVWWEVCRRRGEGAA